MSNQALIDLVTEYEALLEQGEAFFLDQEAYRHLIEHYLHDEAYDRAMEVVERAIDCHSYTADFLLRKAEILIHAHQERQALGCTYPSGQISSQRNRDSLVAGTGTDGFG